MRNLLILGVETLNACERFCVDPDFSLHSVNVIGLLANSIHSGPAIALVFRDSDSFPWHML
jgi:hypothetical protein